MAFQKPPSSKGNRSFTRFIFFVRVAFPVFGTGLLGLESAPPPADAGCSSSSDATASVVGSGLLGSIALELAPRRADAGCSSSSDSTTTAFEGGGGGGASITGSSPSVISAAGLFRIRVMTSNSARYENVDRKSYLQDVGSRFNPTLGPFVPI